VRRRRVDFRAGLDGTRSVAQGHGANESGERTHRRELMGQVIQDTLRSEELPVTVTHGRERSVPLTNRGEGSVFFIRTPADSSEEGGCARLHQ
jgi:hypothetical protein